jgi:hypothetical protein
LATRFNNEEPDADGKYFSDHHFIQTADTCVEGTIKRVLKQPKGTYKVLYDGDTSQSKSPGSHLPATPEDSSSSDSDPEKEKEVESSSSSNVLPTQPLDDSSCPPSESTVSLEDVAAEEAAAELAARVDGADDGYETGGSVDATPEGCVPSNTAEVHEHVWKRKAATPEDPRGPKARPTTTFKDLPVTFDTTELEAFEELMPLSWAQLLARVSARALHHRDKNKCCERDVKAWVALSIGSTQFKPGTDFWGTRAVGLLPPINWGRHLSEDRCRRVTRCLSEAEPLPEGTSSRDRWRDVTVHGW